MFGEFRPKTRSLLSTRGCATLRRRTSRSMAAPSIAPVACPSWSRGRFELLTTRCANTASQTSLPRMTWGAHAWRAMPRSSQPRKTWRRQRRRQRCNPSWTAMGPLPPSERRLPDPSLQHAPRREGDGAVDLGSPTSGLRLSLGRGERRSEALVEEPSPSRRHGESTCAPPGAPSFLPAPTGFRRSDVSRGPPLFETLHRRAGRRMEVLVRRVLSWPLPCVGTLMKSSWIRPRLWVSRRGFWTLEMAVVCTMYHQLGVGQRLRPGLDADQGHPRGVRRHGKVLLLRRALRGTCRLGGAVEVAAAPRGSAGTRVWPRRDAPSCAKGSFPRRTRRRCVCKFMHDCTSASPT